METKCATCGSDGGDEGLNQCADCLKLACDDCCNFYIVSSLIMLSKPLCPDCYFNEIKN
jgi:hypothetical protein